MSKVKTKTFNKHCFCQRRKVRFKYQTKFDSNSVSRLYCPNCLDRALSGTLIIRIDGIKNMLGLWGVKYNSVVLKSQDQFFIDKEQYYKRLFQKGRIYFSKINRRKKKSDYRIIGVKGAEEVKNTEALSGPEKIIATKAEKPTKLPGDRRAGPEESYVPSSGYKGHH